MPNPLQKVIFDSISKFPWEVVLTSSATAKATASDRKPKPASKPTKRTRLSKSIPSSSPHSVSLPALPSDSAIATEPTTNLPQHPGCTAADSVIQVQGYLNALAQGNGGFGVLRKGKDELEEGIQAARWVGKVELAEMMQRIADELPNVRDAEGARVLAEKMQPVVEQSWKLGVACGLAAGKKKPEGE